MSLITPETSKGPGPAPDHLPTTWPVTVLTSGHIKPPPPHPHTVIPLCLLPADYPSQDDTNVSRSYLARLKLNMRSQFIVMEGRGRGGGGRGKVISDQFKHEGKEKFDIYSSLSVSTYIRLRWEQSAEIRNLALLNHLTVPDISHQLIVLFWIWW